MKLILASASVRRAEILHDAGFSFTVLSSAVDETPYPGESAHDLVQRLAFATPELVAARAVGPAVVIRAATEVTPHGHIFGNSLSPVPSNPASISAGPKPNSTQSPGR